MAAGTTLTPDAILHDLGNLWLTLGQRGEIEHGEGVLRACSMTLVVLAEESDDFQALGETLAALMPEHPARTIIARLRSDGKTELSGRVFAQCWMPFGQRRQICCEQIEITAAESGLSDALSLIDAIAAPDLPVVSWCRSLRLLQHSEFGRIAAQSSRLIVDTVAAPDPEAVIARLAELATQGVHIGDLSWTRLTLWREMIAQCFEHPERRNRLRGGVQVRVEYGGPAPPVPARYLMAWLSDSLGAFHVPLSGSVFPAAGANSHGLQRVELTAEDLRIELNRSDSRLKIRGDGISRCVNLPPATDYALMREELGILHADAIFERTLAKSL